MIETTTGVIVFIFGIMIGSFLNVVIYRIPNDESIVFPGSKCQSCQTSLKWYHNIPLFSWLALGGKCSFCSAPISKQYPIVELLTGIIFLALYFKLGIVWYLPFVAASFAALFALVMIDFKYMAVPDSVNFAALIFALAQTEFLTALLNAAIAAGGLYLIGLLSSLIARKQAMGGADVIVAGTMGALLGFPNFFVAIFLSAILAMIPALLNRENGVPFVPFLALATFIVYLYDTQAAQLLETIIHG
jgi:leader peptidase (prepilin peptidase)/N-methyltransferase